jgi:glycosyltransferase involved in cell wall biosynthesis
MNKPILFISIDGMTDMLGQSQVLPYLTKLSEQGYKINIVSCEKEQNFSRNKNAVSEIAGKYNIHWKYCFYSTKIPLLSQVKNFFALKKLAKQLTIESKGDIILHCRSYLPALIGLQLKKELKAKYIFDMRGFWADERIDGNIWSLKNPLHKFLYNYFKRKEIELIEHADCIVTLTDNAKKEIQSWKLAYTPEIEVTPCCTDVTHFLISGDDEKKNSKKNLNIQENSFVLGYLGSLGTWYMLDEMLDFFAVLQIKKPNSIFFFVTNDNEKDILMAAERKNIKTSSILVRSAKRNEVPAYISCFDAGLFFIKPLYSKKGSSPTKMAEILACGIPVITNAGVGDVDKLVTKTNCGIVIPSFKREAYSKAVDEMQILNLPQQHYRDVALSNFSLERGVNSYKKLYSYLSEDK